MTWRGQQEFRQLKFPSSPHSHKHSSTDTRPVAAVGDKCGCRGQMEMLSGDSQINDRGKKLASSAGNKEGKLLRRG